MNTLCVEISNELASLMNPHEKSISRSSTLVGEEDLFNQKLLKYSSQYIRKKPSPTKKPSSIEKLIIKEQPVGYLHWTFGKSIKHLGSGTGGSVQLTMNHQGNLFAIKTYTSTPTSTRILDEALFSLQLNHPNIIRTFEFVKENDQYHAIMEYCPYDLFSLIQQDCLSFEDTQYIFTQIVCGVYYLHTKGLAHRDLKLDNLCISQSGLVKIIDFGCLTSFKSSTLMPLKKEIRLVKGICGSDPYIAPEVFSQEAYDARKVDVWALAVIYLSMVTKHFPWEIALTSDSNYATFLKHPEKVLHYWLPSNSDALPLIQSMLSIDPQQRPTLDQVVQDSWFQSLCA